MSIETTEPTHADDPRVALLEAVLRRGPSGTVEGARALAIGVGAVDATALLQGMGASAVVTCAERNGHGPEQAWPGLESTAHERFGIACVDGAIEVEPNPMGLLGRIWTACEPGALLVLGAQVAADARLSQYAVKLDDGPRRGWLPGRLTLRWMVETSGFAVESIEDRPSGGDSPAADCVLVATRVDRNPVVV